MSEKKTPASKVILGSTKGKLVRFAYLHGHDSHLNSESGNNEWSVRAMIPKENVEDIAAVRAAIDEQKRNGWLDEKKNKVFLPPKFWNPLIDADADVKQNGQPYDAEFHGHYLVSAKIVDDGKNDPPQVIGTTKGSDNRFIPLGPKEIKSGDWGRCSVNFKFYTKGTGGVGVYLNSVQLVKQGVAMSSRASAEDDYSSFDDQDDDDPMLA